MLFIFSLFFYLIYIVFHELKRALPIGRIPVFFAVRRLKAGEGNDVGLGRISKLCDGDPGKWIGVSFLFVPHFVFNGKRKIIEHWPK